MNPVTELPVKIDHSRILDEYLSIQPDQSIPTEYTITRVFNSSIGGYEPNIQGCEYIKEVCDIVSQHASYNVGLFRLMPLRTTLTWHRDVDLDPIGWHIPILTAPGCFYAYEDKIYTLPTIGQLYAVENQQFHTFVNASDTTRLHLHFIKDNLGVYSNYQFAG